MSTFPVISAGLVHVYMNVDHAWGDDSVDTLIDAANGFVIARCLPLYFTPALGSSQSGTKPDHFGYRTTINDDCSRSLSLVKPSSTLL